MKGRKVYYVESVVSILSLLDDMGTQEGFEPEVGFQPYTSAFALNQVVRICASLNFRKLKTTRTRSIRCDRR